MLIIVLHNYYIFCFDALYFMRVYICLHGFSYSLMKTMK